MFKASLIVTITLFTVVYGAQIDVKDCLQNGNPEGPKFYSESTGNRVSVAVVGEPFVNEQTSTVSYDMSGFMNEDLTDGEYFMMYKDMSPYEKCKLMISPELAVGAKAFIVMWKVGGDEKDMVFYECKVSGWSGFGRRRMLMI